MDYIKSVPAALDVYDNNLVSNVNLKYFDLYVSVVENGFLLFAICRTIVKCNDKGYLGFFLYKAGVNNIELIIEKSNCELNLIFWTINDYLKLSCCEFQVS